MKQAALALLLVALLPMQASALETNELLGLVAMPLAVAAVSEVSGVPVNDLGHFVATLNRAQVPPTQVVQVVRYAPVALVATTPGPTFVEYVDQQVYDGVTGSRLVTVIEERYRTYDLEPQFVVLDEPATTFVVRDDYVPNVVVTRMAQVSPSYVVSDTNDLLALAMMPLAVAAVADITGVPFSDLGSFVSSLNAARMPPVQVVEVLRYSPVVLVNDYERPLFVNFVETQVVSGVRGSALIDVIGDRLRVYDVTPRFDVIEPQQYTFVDNDAFFPAVVTTQVATARAHPHGGPPGQLKKQRGLQTGAEVVHGTTSRRAVSRDRMVVTSDREPRLVRERRTVKPAKATRAVQRVEQPRAERAPKAQRVKAVEQPKAERAPKAKGGGRGSASPAPSQESDGKGQGKGKGKGKG